MRREMYPLDIHSEISGSYRHKSDSKGLIIKLVLVALVFVFAILGNMLLGFLGVPFLGFIAGLLIGMWISLLIGNKISERNEELIENPDENKAMKFFKINLGREEFVEDTPVIEYTNGDKAIILSISLGNQTQSGHHILADFLDNLFSICHKNRIKFRIFTTNEGWEDSDIQDRLLRKYGKIHDTKLKSVLFESISKQSIDFEKSNIMQINIIFIDRDFSLNKLRTVISYVNTFKEKDLKLSSIRHLRFNTETMALRLFCKFLGIKLIDSSPLADKNQVYLDTKSLVRPFNSDLFYSSPRLTRHLTNTMAKKFRSPKKNI